MRSTHRGGYGKGYGCQRNYYVVSWRRLFDICSDGGCFATVECVAGFAGRFVAAGTYGRFFECGGRWFDGVYRAAASVFVAAGVSVPWIIWVPWVVTVGLFVVGGCCGFASCGGSACWWVFPNPAAVRSCTDPGACPPSSEGSSRPNHCFRHDPLGRVDRNPSWKNPLLAHWVCFYFSWSYSTCSKIPSPASQTIDSGCYPAQLQLC
mmetsp:Transcript_13694/g.16785  ORF Transcript_13694/g.16785 Transcript_13694/m.16785 type:complete len:207 (+) Transcript_13694:539-1159(+)